MSVTVKPTAAPVVAPQKGNPLVRGLTSGGASQIEALLGSNFANLQNYLANQDTPADNSKKEETPQEKSRMPMVNNRVAGIFHLNEVGSEGLGAGVPVPLDAITRGVGIYQNNMREIAADAAKEA